MIEMSSWPVIVSFPNHCTLCAVCSILLGPLKPNYSTALEMRSSAGGIFGIQHRKHVERKLRWSSRGHASKQGAFDTEAMDATVCRFRRDTQEALLLLGGFTICTPQVSALLNSETLQALRAKDESRKIRETYFTRHLTARNLRCDYRRFTSWPKLLACGV